MVATNYYVYRTKMIIQDRPLRLTSSKNSPTVFPVWSLKNLIKSLGVTDVSA